MDFVVVGFGLGGLGVLLGVVMLGWLAERWERAATRAPSPDDAAHDLAMAADRRAAGRAFLYAGGAVFLATVGGLAGSLDDGAGAFLVATTATVAVLGILLWGYLHRSRNPASPLLRRRPRSVPVTGAEGVAAPLSFADDLLFSAPTIPDGDVIVPADDAIADDARTGQDHSAAAFLSLVPNGESESAEPASVDEPSLAAEDKGDRVIG